MKSICVSGRRLLGAVVTAAVVGCLAGCSDGMATTPAEAVGSTASSVLDEGTSAQVVAPVFRAMREAMDPVPVFGMARIPEGMILADGWWPVIEVEDGGSTGLEANPSVVGAGSPEPEGQLLLRAQDGWLCIVENFRGDLGDVQGETVGTVGGEQAYGFEVNGGWLVQWAYEGRWYGVFGRGVSRELVLTTALSMSLVIDGN